MLWISHAPAGALALAVVDESRPPFARVSRTVLQALASDNAEGFSFFLWHCGGQAG